MNNKYLGLGIALLISFAAGRYLAPTKIVTKTVEVEKKQVDTKKDEHKVTTVTETDKPDGTKTIVTQTTDNTGTERTSKDVVKSDTTTTKTYGGAKTSINALAGLSSGATPTYGLAVTRSVLGPITVGAFGLTDRTFGVSLGLEF